MFDISKEAVAVDFFSTHVDYQHEIAYHTDPTWALQMAQKVSRRVCLRHDYLPYEFCLYIYKLDDIENTCFIYD